MAESLVTRLVKIAVTLCHMYTVCWIYVVAQWASGHICVAWLSWLLRGCCVVVSNLYVSCADYYSIVVI